MRTILLVLLFCMSVACVAQQTVIKGVTLTPDNALLPYANIGITGTPVGTVSNSEGAFTLKLPSNLNPESKIVFSYIGYATQEHTLATLLDKQNRIVLQPQERELDEVVINLKAPKPKKIGRTITGLGLMHQNFYTAFENDADDRLSKEMGMKLSVNNNCRVNDLNFNITTNEFESVTFRINFYKVVDGLPGDLLLEDNITCEVKAGQLGWFTADLKPYDIYLTQDLKEVAVTLQWLESKKSRADSKYFAIASSMAPLNTSYFREKGMDKWLAGSSGMSFYLNVMSQ